MGLAPGLLQIGALITLMHSIFSLTGGADSWTLLANPNQLTVADVYRLFMFDGSGNPVLAQQVEAAIEAGLGRSLSGQFALKN